jgi:YHS domain-containing protein
MTVFRSRSAFAVCSLMGTTVSISLAGYVWAQQPAENWPFEEHNTAQATQPAAPPAQKSPVQQRLEELYRRDNRPLPDYMRQDGSSEQAAPAQAGDVGSLRTQREASPPTQGNVHQQLSDYYQSQGKAMPAPQRAAGSSSMGSTQNSPYQSGTASQPGTASAAQPAPGHWYDRINPFHKSTPPAQPQTQVQSSVTVSTVASDANYSAPAPQGVVRITSPTAPVHGSPAELTVQESTSQQSAPSAASAKSSAASDAPAPVAAAPVAKSGSFWGDMTLRRVPSQPAASPFPTPIVVDLGPGHHLVRKTRSPAAPAPEDAPVVAAHSSPSKVNLAVVAPGAIVSSAEPTAPAAPKVAAANAVADDPAMPFLAASEAEADHQTSNGPYTGMTLEDEQNQLTPPTPDAPRRTAASSATHAPATIAADAHHAEPPKSVSPAPQSKDLLPADSHETADHNPAAKPSHDAPAHAIVTDHEPTSSAAPQQQASDEPSGHKTISDLPVADEQPAVAPHPSAAPDHVVAPHHPPEQHAEQHAASEHSESSAHSRHPQTAREKARLIEERAGQRGLKGFCPVVLRDQRELADVNAAYCSIYHGRKYYFSSAAAEARFEASPHKYAPVAGGVDVVVKTNSDQDVEGSLDFALWYKDRLYLFCSPESLQAFSLSPTAYSAAAQRIE